jgi:RNA polymerase sigma factor (sigma-70 family)
LIGIHRTRSGTTAMAKGTAEAVRRHIHKLVGRHIDSQATDRELLERFTTAADAAAFEALFRRHEAMVVATGRRILCNEHDAEDVCQAAFLLLAKKAASQRWQPSVASWLYRTAYLLALKARTMAIRRGRREDRAEARPPTDPLDEITGRELLAVLDEELLRLPESLRAPLVLCYLQGTTRDEAAQRMGCPLSTLGSRLQRGRARLHAALVRRGLGFSTVLLGAHLAQETANAAATLGFGQRTATAALAVAAGKSMDAVVSSQVSQLVKGGLGIMRWDLFKTALVLLVAAGLLSTAGALAYSARNDQQPGSPPKEASAAQVGNAKLPAAGTAHARGVTLRYQFKEGEKFSYVVEKKTETGSGIAGADRVVVSTWTCDVTWKVKSVDSDGNARMMLTINRIQYVGENGLLGKVEFDSSKHNNPVGLPPLVKVLSPVLKAQVGADFTCTMSPRGAVSDFKVPKKVADAVKNTQGVQALYSTDSFRQQLACQGGVVLPRDPVVKGATWNQKTDAAIAGGHAKMTVDSKAAYEGEGDKSGKKLQEIALQPTARIDNSAPTGLGPVTLKKQEGAGSMLFDNATGRLIETAVSQTLDMESSPPGQNEKIAWKIKLSLSTKLVAPK